MTTQYTPAQLEAWAKLNADTVIDCLAGIEVPQMEGDNLAVTLCSYFENPDQEEDEQGWTPDSIKGYEEVMAAIRDHLAPLAAAPDLARLVLEKDAEIARLKGLAWIAFHEFNAINARSGGPLDHYGMVTVTHEYWQAITNLFAKAAGETTPWPTENAKVIFEEINRQAMKETSDE